MYLNRDMVDDEEDQKLEEITGDITDEISTKLDGDLDLPAVCRRPIRIIKPVQDKKDLIKFVDSDDDSDDEEDVNWEVTQAEEVGSEDSADEEDPSKNGSSSESDESEDKEIAENECYTEDNSNVTAENTENQELEPISISKDDMPFLFVSRGAGKREIKVIQYKNEIAERAKDMSSESSSEDEEWQAKQEDITEQIVQENGEEDVDMTNVPLMDESHKAVNTTIEKKPKDSSNKVLKISQLEALDASICCVCLTGPEEDNVIECDSCGITIHEGCYGATPTDPDNEEIDMTWFCEPCVANLDELQCELCPNKNGVMKHTDSGKFAHLVCALYSDGIGFNDTVKLEPIITTDIPPSKFGYKKCDLCEDTRFAFTGLVVECDAGLCKSSFHITCAQKLGYLMENSSEDIKTNPFFAYCKVHVDKDIARPNKKAYVLLQEHLKAFKNKAIDNDKQMSLQTRRKEYIEIRIQAVVPAVMTERHPRALFGSVSAFTNLTKKAELFGLNTHANIIEETDFTEKSVKVIKPDVSVEFAKQYEIRQSQREETVDRYNYHYKNLLNLREEEHKLQAEINELQVQVPKVSKKYEKVRKQAVAIWKFLSIVEPTEYDIPDCLMQKQNIKIKSHVIKRKIGLKFCHICKHGDALESMVDCDECHNWFHFSCLDPPLTRNPKVSKKWAWFCTGCTTKDIESQAPGKEQNGFMTGHNNSKQASDDLSEVKSTKCGRAVKKPDHYKSDEPIKEKSQSQNLKIIPQRPESAENMSALKSLQNIEETQCTECKKRDSSKKLFCDFCKKHYHLQCTTGSYESSSFICNGCEALTAVVPNLEMKKMETGDIKSPESDLTTVVLNPVAKQLESDAVKNPDSDLTKTHKRKNIFELQYDLLCQKRKREDTSESMDQNVQKKSNCNALIDKTDYISTEFSGSHIKAVNDHVSNEEEETQFLDEEAVKPQQDITPPPKASLFSNIIKDIQMAVSKVPEDSKVKLGMSPIKSMRILDDSGEAEPGDVVPVIVEVNETESFSNQTVLTILTSGNVVEAEPGNVVPVTVGVNETDCLSNQTVLTILTSENVVEAEPGTVVPVTIGVNETDCLSNQTVLTILASENLGGAEPGTVVPVTVTVNETKSLSNQTALTILASEIMSNENNHNINSRPSIITLEKSVDSDGSLSDMLSS